MPRAYVGPDLGSDYVGPDGGLLGGTPGPGDLTWYPAFPDRVPPLAVRRALPSLPPYVVTILMPDISLIAPASWKPSFPLHQLPPIPPVPPPSVFVAPFSYEAYPVTDLLASETFQPTFPAETRAPAPRQPRWEVVAPPAVATSATAWFPTFPTSVSRRTLCTAARPPLSAIVPGALVVTAQQLAWSPRMPAWIPRPVARHEQFVYRDPPAVIAAGVHCVFWEDTTTVNPTFTAQTLTAPGFNAAPSTTYQSLVGPGGAFVGPAGGYVGPFVDLDAGLSVSVSRFFTRPAFLNEEIC